MKTEKKMLDKKMVGVKLLEFSIVNTIELQDGYIGIMANELIEIGFTNEMFLTSINKLKYKEDFYGKMPTPKMFVDNCGVKLVAIEDSEKDKALESCLKKFDNYMNAFTMGDKHFILKNLNPLEKDVFNMQGGLSEMFARSNNASYPASISKMKDRIVIDFDNCYSKEKMVVIENCDKVKEITSGLSSKLKGY